MSKSSNFQVLWFGQVADPAKNSEATQAFRKVNKMAFDDPEVDSAVLNVGDGVLLAFKK